MNFYLLGILNPNPFNLLVKKNFENFYLEYLQILQMPFSHMKFQNSHG